MKISVKFDLRPGSTCDPKNRPIVEAILVANAAGMRPQLAANAYNIYVDETTGCFRKPVFDPEAIKTVLALRSKFGAPRKTLTDPAQYDASHLTGTGIN